MYFDFLRKLGFDYRAFIRSAHFACYWRVQKRSWIQYWI